MRLAVGQKWTSSFGNGLDKITSSSPDWPLYSAAGLKDAAARTKLMVQEEDNWDTMCNAWLSSRYSMPCHCPEG